MTHICPDSRDSGDSLNHSLRRVGQQRAVESAAPTVVDSTAEQNNPNVLYD